LLRKKATRLAGNRKYKDEEKGILEKYREYAFTEDFEDETKTWLSFLETYFKKTQRQELSTRSAAAATSGTVHFSSLPPGKIDSQHGEGFTVPSIKNYPRIPHGKDREPEG
jgi:hypothetical protein